MALQVRRGTNAQRLLITPLPGELIYTTDTRNVYVGDGLTLGGILVSGSGGGLLTEDVQDICGPMFTGGTHTGISFTYDDETGTVNAVVTDEVGITEIVADTTPQLGGNLDLNSFDIFGIGDINIDGSITVTDTIVGDFKGRILSPDDSSLILGGNVLNLDNISINGNDPEFGGEYSSVSTVISSLGKIGVDSKMAFLGPTNGLTFFTEGTFDDDYDLFTFLIAKDSSTESGMVAIRTRGDLSDLQPVQNGDDIFTFLFLGKTPTSEGAVGTIKITVDGAPAGDNVPGKIALITYNSSGNPKEFSIDSSGVINVEANTLVAGVASGEVNVSSVSTYLKINVGGTEYAVPLYAINP